MSEQKVWRVPLDIREYCDFEKAWYSGKYWRQVAIKDLNGAVIVVKKTLQDAAFALSRNSTSGKLCNAKHFEAHLQASATVEGRFRHWRWLRHRDLLRSEEAPAPDNDATDSAIVSAIVPAAAAVASPVVVVAPKKTTWAAIFKSPALGGTIGSWSVTL